MNTHTHTHAASQHASRSRIPLCFSSSVTWACRTRPDHLQSRAGIVKRSKKWWARSGHVKLRNGRQEVGATVKLGCKLSSQWTGRSDSETHEECEDQAVVRLRISECVSFSHTHTDSPELLFSQACHKIPGKTGCLSFVSINGSSCFNCETVRGESFALAGRKKFARKRDAV